MPPHDVRADASGPFLPSMLDLVRLSPRRLFPPGGEELYRQIALLTDMAEGQEVLGVACGKGISLEYFVREFDVVASGVDVDPRMVEEAEAWCRETGIADRLQFQSGRSDALPYRDEIFDVTVGEIGLANHCEPEDAIRELVRVTKPGGYVVLVQLVWKAPVDAGRQRVLSEHLGARPLMVVEWKRLFREAEVEDVHTEDWSDEETAFRPTVVKPFPDFAELFSLPEKIGILRRAWRRWGWRGVRSLLTREIEVHRLLTGERILGLDLMKGRKAGLPRRGKPVVDASPEDRGEEPVPARRSSATATVDPASSPSRTAEAGRAAAAGGARDDGGVQEDGGAPEDARLPGDADEGTEGLPLFGAEAPATKEGD